MAEQELLQQLQNCLSKGDLITDPEERALLSHDIAGTGAIAAAVVRPVSTASLADAVKIAGSLGYALVPRGSGHSYSGGTTPAETRSVVIDTTALDQVIEVDPHNRLVRVQAGCTWATLLDALAPHGMRTPFFGPLSGITSTIGGALSQRATFFGSAMHGMSDRSVAGLAVVLADGSVMRTGIGHDGRAHPQASGPDLGALFLGDCGALGIKAEATLRLINRPGAEAFASFSYPNMAAMLRAQIALSGLNGLAECFGFDRQAHVNLAAGGFEILEGAEIVADVLRQPGTLRQRLGRMTQLVKDGRRKVGELQCSLHLCLEGDDEDIVQTRLAAAAEIAVDAGGEPLPDTIPRVTRSRPFRPIRALLGPDGERWLPFHGVFRLGDVFEAQGAFEDAVAPHQERLDGNNMKVSLLTVSSGDTIVLEPHLFWPDSLHLFHRRHVTKSQLQDYGDQPDQPEVRAFAHDLRQELGSVLHNAGAEHLQIGRHYPYQQELDPVPLGLLHAIKKQLDPNGIMAPGVLLDPPNDEGGDA